jgi:hypothetical protein
MRNLLSSVVGLALFGCGADPGNEPRSSPSVAMSEDRPRPAPSPEVPRPTIAAMQLCADRYAPRLPGESFAVMYDVEFKGTGNTVKVKDSMLGGSPLEHCLAGALEQMDVPVTAHFQPNVSPSSRSMVGIVQAAAAPIALMPIALVAGGVTILIGVTIYVASEITKEKERCNKVKQGCIDDCSDDTLDDGFHEPMFSRCVRSCMEQANCR